MERFNNDLLLVGKAHPVLRILFLIIFTSYLAVAAFWYFNCINSIAPAQTLYNVSIGRGTNEKVRLLGDTGLNQLPPGDIYTGTALSPGFDMGVNTSEGKTDWVTDHQGYMECRYPEGQQWGAVFITVGKPSNRVDQRKTRNFSQFDYLTLELKGAKGGERVAIGVKTDTDPDDGSEPKHLVTNLTTDWQTIRIPLVNFVREPEHPKARLNKLYVVCELVFELDFPAEVVAFRNVRFETQSDVGKNPRQLPPGNIYTGETLSSGFDMGVNTSEGKTDWVVDHHGYMECRYPKNQQWGAVFITVGRPTPQVASRRTKDFSKYRFLILELKGARGGEQVAIGVKAADDPDDGSEPKHLVTNLTTSWQTIKIPLSEFVQEPDYPIKRLSRLYVVSELVFEPGFPAQVVSFRNIRFEP